MRDKLQLWATPYSTLNEFFIPSKTTTFLEGRKSSFNLEYNQYTLVMSSNLISKDYFPMACAMFDIHTKKCPINDVCMQY